MKENGGASEWRASLAIGALNLDPRVLSQIPSKPVFLCDCTLREGEQSAGAAFSKADKVRVARLLDEMGVHQVQVGYAGVSREDADMIRTLVAENLRAEIECIAMVHVSNWREHIEAAVACEPDIVSMQYGTSDLRLEKVLKVSREQAIDTMVQAVRYARERGAKVVSFSPTDTSRTDLDFLVQIVTALADAGVDRVRVADSMGAISPTAFRYLVKTVRDALPDRVMLGVHCHNDYGLALANIVAALEGGADFFDGVVNGMGERAGNVSLDELALVLEHLYDRRTGIDLSRFGDLARLVEEMSGTAIPPNKPVVGENAFAHQLDNHIRGVAITPALYEPYPPELVGNHRRLPLGRLSGEHAVRLKLSSLGYLDDGVDIPALAADVRREAEAVRGEVDDAGFARLAERAGAARAEQAVR
ncbi:MAG: homoaconitate hydratase [Dehalococcoidia bacterium]